MALETEVWSEDIQENLFADDAFVLRGTDHSAFISNLTVHVPQAGANPAVEKARAVIPAVIKKRTDTDLTYNLAEFTTEPIVVRDVEDLQNSYDKRMSVLRQHVDTLGETIGNHTAFEWGVSNGARIVRTSGSAVATALSSGATGTRNAITLVDIAKLRAIMDKDNVPKKGRVLLIDSDIYNNQLITIPDVYQQQSIGMSNLPEGVVQRLYGFDIMIRSFVITYDDAGTPVRKPIGANGLPIATATDDNIGCIAFHPSFVSQAVGGTNIFSEEKSPTMYGDVFSAGQMFGAAKLRTDQKGLATLVQT